MSPITAFSMWSAAHIGLLVVLLFLVISLENNINDMRNMAKKEEIVRLTDGCFVPRKPE